MTKSPDDAAPAHLAFLREGDRGRLRAVSPRKRAVQARSRETVEAILEAAARVLEREGFGRATTDRIAEVAGVSIGSLYQYFPHKDAIAVALMERHGQEGLDDVLPVLRRLAEDPPPLEDGIGLLVDALLASHLERPALHRALADEATVPPFFRARRRQLARALAPILERYFRRVLGERAGLGRAATSVAASLEALVHAFTADAPEGLAPAEIAAQIRRMLLAVVPREDG